MIRIIVYDDSDERRDSLQVLFSMSENMVCVGAFSDTSLLPEQLTELCPDIILMDIRMPGMNGIESAIIAKQLFPAIKIIIQTVFEDDENVFNSLKVGVEGYILKSTAVEKIFQCIDDVYNGGAVITPSIALKVTRYFNGLSKEKMYHHDLTSREKEVLTLLTEGMSYKMVAAELQVTYHTVNAHVKKIYEKLCVNSVSEAVTFALRNKIV